MYLHIYQFDGDDITSFNIMYEFQSSGDEFEINLRTGIGVWLNGHASLNIFLSD
jgi:hypothetical protein